jgi:signal transduction histidine kinase
VVARWLRSAAILLPGAAAPSTTHQRLNTISFMTARWERRAVRLAWGTGLTSFGFVIAIVVLLALNWSALGDQISVQFPWFTNAIIVAALGVLIATRRPRNSIGWLLLAIGFSNALSLLATFIAARGLYNGATPGSWVVWPVWLENWLGLGSAFLLLFLIFFFPTGGLPGPHWRWVARAAAALAVIAVVGATVTTGTTQLASGLAKVANPIGVGPISAVIGTNSPGFGVGLISVLLLSVCAAAVRFRHSQGVERRQMRWFAYATAASIAVSLVGFLMQIVNSNIGGALSGIGFDLGLAVVIPGTIGLAVMRYGLYDIDVFISRTIVYGSLAVFITAVYVGIAVGIGTLVGSDGKPNLALSIVATAIVAIGFQPVREWVQRVANRLVYGERATPYEVLSQFSERVAESYASDEVLPRMARVLANGTAAELAEVWLRSGVELRRAAAFPLDTAMPALVLLNGAAEVSIPTTDRSVVVRHQGEVLGALTVTKRRGESLTPIEIKLMDDLAHQAGLVLKNVGLTADLQARLIDLRASRQRLVAAQDDERRKLERNLHDGAQQYLVAIKVKLGLVEMLLTKDTSKATTTLQELKGDANEALETLRDLARGIYPPLLADKGLLTAIQAQARKATLPITVEANDMGRYPQDTEAALYFCILEAMQNVQKYAHASSATVRLQQDRDQLTVEVSDDGRGFDVSTTIRGNGLTNMEDRLDALGGKLQVESALDRGTTLRATVPVSHTVVAAS